MNRLLRFLSLTGALLCAGATQAEPQTSSAAFFRDLAETRDYSLGNIVSPKFTPDGKTVIFLRGGARDPVLRLYAFDIATSQERELITPAQVLGSAEEQLSPEEKARRERARVSVRGFTRFELSKDGHRLIVSLSGKLYMLNLPDLQAVELPGQGWIDPRLSPDGKYLAAVAKNELHVIDLLTREARQITTGATETLHHAVAEFVAQEEMGRSKGYWWSPDSAHLAYQENDESGVEVRYIADPLRPEAKPQAFFYPRAGTANTKVRLGVISRDGGETRWIDWDREAFPYLARVVWDEPAAPLTLLVQNRAQQKQMLLTANTTTGKTRTLLTETDAAWLNLDFAETPIWLPGGKQFLWTTERKGAWQVELRKAGGGFVRFVTPRDFGYKRLIDVNAAKGVVSVQGASDPRETQVWQFPLAGGKGVQVTSGSGTHSAVFAKATDAYVHSYHLRDGKLGAEIVTGASAVPLPTVIETPPSLPVVELTRTKSAHVMDAAIIRPKDFAKDKKYPVILYVYAGPTAKRVTSSLRSYFLDQWMADQGYIVVRIDNRGTPGYGRDWERIIRGNFIDIALQDQIDGLRALAAQYPEMDLARVGVTGWSFGGYFSAMATMRRPDVFKAGVAGAPVITWENYDTHYTERYLGLPAAAPEAYRVSNVTTYVKELQRPLLLIHGLTDDNVYAQHTLQAIDALFMAGKPYEFMPMLGTHMISDPQVRQNQQERIMEFFGRTLK
ncbi:MAG: DPP IV N-terminal domain-containing protein [Rhodospirillaceae bacterium]|nr:DPP IV N-terminal domain-containing protein [Rhodospirillaceae bacterium]